MALMRFNDLSDADRQALADSLGIGLVDEHGHCDPALLAALLSCPDAEPDDRPVEIDGVTYRFEDVTVIVEVRLGRLTWREPRRVRRCVLL